MLRWSISALLRCCSATCVCDALRLCARPHRHRSAHTKRLRSKPQSVKHTNYASRTTGNRWDIMKVGRRRRAERCATTSSSRRKKNARVVAIWRKEHNSVAVAKMPLLAEWWLREQCNQQPSCLQQSCPPVVPPRKTRRFVFFSSTNCIKSQRSVHPVVCKQRCVFMRAKTYSGLADRENRSLSHRITCATHNRQIPQRN